MKRIVHGDNLQVLQTLSREHARLIYIDPPFNTGQTQSRERVRVRAADQGERKGFGGRRYEVERLDSPAYEDDFDEYLPFLMSRIEAALRCLTGDGSLFVHLDYREVHYVKVALDRLLGRECFMQRDHLGVRLRRPPEARGPPSTTRILWYALDPDDYVFDFDEIDRIPYMAPGSRRKREGRGGKTPTDVWWHTIVPTNGARRRATRRRSRSACWTASSRSTASPGIRFWTSSREAGRPVRRQRA